MRFPLSLIASVALGQLALGDPSHLQSRQASNNASHATDYASSPPDSNRWPGGMHLSTDYYPSQWPEDVWESDFAAMRDANISYIRVSEFDWALLEPSEGQYNFTVLDRTLELCGKYGIRAIVGTPTAAPPDWVVENYDVDYVDVLNRTLLFGSRRGYSFSSFDYRRLSQGIVTALAKRYGNNSNIVAWQLDNEVGTQNVRSYDHNAMIRFRTWLQQKYGTIEAMNDAQGRVFWSDQYVSFDAIQPPFLEVYVLNQAHLLDFYTFSSDMVIDFCKEQTAILRQYAPTQAVTTNFVSGFTDYDIYKFSREVGLDLATFDSYPLSTISTGSAADQQTYLRTGLPDFQMQNQDRFRGVAGAAYGMVNGPFGVMEQQPSIVNFAPVHVRPAKGMVRLWTLETFAATGSMVSYFRWRQVPYAQEQALAGLHLSDGTPNQGFVESQIVADDDLPMVREASENEQGQADVALIFDFQSVWVWAIEPYSGNWDYTSAGYTDTLIAYSNLVDSFYTALRRLGVTVDMISPEQSLEGYKMVVVPSLPIMPAGSTFDIALANFNGSVVFGPHTASKTPNYAYSPGLPPSAGTLRDRLPLRVLAVESPPDYAGSGVMYDGTNYPISAFEETIVCTRQNANSSVTVTSTSPDRVGDAAACENNGLHYLGFAPPVDFLVSYLGDVAGKVNVIDRFGKVASKATDLGPSLRITRHGDLLWAFNYGNASQALPKVDGTLVLGQGSNAKQVPSHGVKLWNMAS